jgi:Ser/Thr protein kinase RdoA (MazF antagonist)
VAQAYAEGDVERLQSLARSALPHWGFSEDSELRLLNLSENATFTVTAPDAGSPTILRIGRPDYSSVPEVESELAWIEALAADRAVRTASVVRTVAGLSVVELASAEFPRPRPCVAFGFVPGEEAPEDGDLDAPLRALGGLAARMHGHARAWRRPAAFQRRRWDYETTIGENGIWGRWQDGIGVGPAEMIVLGRLAELLRVALQNYGRTADRFGLVHADFRLANVLFNGPDTYIIDFDDCGWSWFMYDLATCFTFIEDRGDLFHLINCWLAGYREVTPLGAEAEAIIPTMIMLRRLLVLAWVGSHAETPLAQEVGVAYTEGTCQLAERYMEGDGPGQ